MLQPLPLEDDRVAEARCTGCSCVLSRLHTLGCLALLSSESHLSWQAFCTLCTRLANMFIPLCSVKGRTLALPKRPNHLTLILIASHFNCLPSNKNPLSDFLMTLTSRAPSRCLFPVVLFVVVSIGLQQPLPVRISRGRQAQPPRN